MGKRIRQDYRKIPDELRSLLFDLEKSFGLSVGGGVVFDDKRKKREITDIRHCFLYIANQHLDYSESLIAEYLGVKRGIFFNAKRRVRNNIQTNRAFRNKLYGVAVNNGVIGLIHEIVSSVDGSKKG